MAINSTRRGKGDEVIFLQLSWYLHHFFPLPSPTPSSLSGNGPPRGSGVLPCALCAPPGPHGAGEYPRAPGLGVVAHCWWLAGEHSKVAWMWSLGPKLHSSFAKDRWHCPVQTSAWPHANQCLQHDPSAASHSHHEELSGAITDLSHAGPLCSPSTGGSMDPPGAVPAGRDASNSTTTNLPKEAPPGTRFLNLCFHS